MPVLGTLFLRQLKIAILADFFWKKLGFGGLGLGINCRDQLSGSIVGDQLSGLIVGESISGDQLSGDHLSGDQLSRDQFRGINFGINCRR